MKLKAQLKYFINGIILIILALIVVTVFPFFLKAKFGVVLPAYLYYQIEFFLLCAGGAFFVFSPKYYKEQISIILFGVLYYILFVKFN